MEQETQTEQPPAYEAGENFVAGRLAGLQALLTNDIDLGKLTEIEAILSKF